MFLGKEASMAEAVALQSALLVDVNAVHLTFSGLPLDWCYNFVFASIKSQACHPLGRFGEHCCRI